MHPLHRFVAARTGILCLTLAAHGNVCNAGIDISQAAAQVKSLSCKENLTVDQTLDKSIKSHSQRDIGWRAFQEDDFFDIERAVLINKGMELRYRWRVSIDGSVKPQNERAEKLCSLQSD